MEQGVSGQMHLYKKEYFILGIVLTVLISGDSCDTVPTPPDGSGLVYRPDDPDNLGLELTSSKLSLFYTQSFLR